MLYLLFFLIMSVARIRHYYYFFLLMMCVSYSLPLPLSLSLCQGCNSPALHFYTSARPSEPVRHDLTIMHIERECAHCNARRTRFY